MLEISIGLLGLMTILVFVDMLAVKKDEVSITYFIFVQTSLLVFVVINIEPVLLRVLALLAEVILVMVVAASVFRRVRNRWFAASDG